MGISSLEIVDVKSKLLTGKGYMSLNSKEEKIINKFDNWAKKEIKNNPKMGKMSAYDAINKFKSAYKIR